MTAFIVIASEAKQSRAGVPNRSRLLRRLRLLAMTGGFFIMPITFLMLPPQGDRTREWARRLSQAHPELRDHRAGDDGGGRAGDHRRRGRLRHDPAGPAGARRETALAAGAAGGAAGRLLLPAS